VGRIDQNHADYVLARVEDIGQIFGLGPAEVLPLRG